MLRIIECLCGCGARVALELVPTGIQFTFSYGMPRACSFTFSRLEQIERVFDASGERNPMHVDYRNEAKTAAAKMLAATKE